MKQSDLKNAFNSLTMKEVILDKHGLQGPSTFRRNNTKTPIDGIWATPNISILAGGYFDYDEVILNTDHRCLWIDVSYITAFGHTMLTIIKPAARRLHCKDPRLVDNYVQTYKKFILKNNLLGKVRKLKMISSHPLSSEGKHLYEEIDGLRCKGVKLAEKKCRKLRMGQVAFSPQLQKAGRIIKAWCLLDKKARGLRVSSRLISRSLKKVSIPMSARSMKKEDIALKLKEAYQDYYKTKGSSKELRASAMDERIEALALTGNSTKEKILKTIKHREKQKSTARKIKMLRGKLKSGSTTIVSIQQEDGSYKDLTGKLEIEQAIMDNNMEKYQQSFHTPFMQDPLRTDFSFKGLTTSSLAVLGGVYTPRDDLDDYTKSMIKELEMPDKVRALGPNNMAMDVESYRQYWKKANENISCYPAEMSFATMKAGASDDMISGMECNLINCALLSGYSPDRWKKFLDVMILKKSGITHLSSLRTIVLFPVDCNFAFKHIGREMMKIAEATNSLAPEQYGSRRHHRAIDLAVCKALTYDLLRQLKRPGAICSNDARSCYDLIGHAQASIAMQRNGVPRAAVDCLFTTLQEAKHQVRKSYGDSYLSYGGSNWVTPMHGIGQGNGAGPAIWAVLSTPLLNLLRSQGFGCKFTSPISKETLQFVGYAFVDDTDVIESKPNVNSDVVVHGLQQAVDYWEGGLKATCGAIVPEKTFWYLIDFKWNSGSWYYKSIDDCPGTIYINDINGNRKELRRCQVDDAQETLGVFLAPDGNTRQQQCKMLALATEWADCMRTGMIPKDDAWLAFHSTIWKSLTYLLPALNLSKADCEQIMRPILQYLLPAIGVCRNFPRSLVYTSEKYMGIGLKHLHSTQEIYRLKDLLSHVYRHTNMCKLYRNTLENMILEVGMGTDILQLNPQVIQLLATDTLIKSTCLFLLQHNIELKHDISMPPLRNGDQIIMKAFGRYNLSFEELCVLNKCRLYLQVYFLSEICTGDGLSITEEAWRGVRFEVPFKILSWPSFPRPSSKEWTTWQLFIKKAFLHRGLRLHSTLGHWTASDCSWEWFFSPSQECLFQTSQGTWKSYSQIIRRNRLPIFSSQAHPQHPPPDLCRATIYTKGSRIVCTGYTPQIKETISKASCFSDFLREAKIGEKWCMENGDGSHIAQAIREGVAIAISDGSYQDTYGTASWVIEGQDSSGRLVGDVIVPGSASDQSAYRSELAGIYSILVMAKKVCEYFHILQGSIELGCDGQSALDKAFNYVSIIRIEDADHDLLHAIRNLWALSPLTWKFRHVKGHQDDTNSIENLDR